MSAFLRILTNWLLSHQSATVELTKAAENVAEQELQQLEEQIQAGRETESTEQLEARHRALVGECEPLARNVDALRRQVAAAREAWCIEEMKRRDVQMASMRAVEAAEDTNERIQQLEQIEKVLEGCMIPGQGFVPGEGRCDWGSHPSQLEARIDSMKKARSLGELATDLATRLAAISAGIAQAPHRQQEIEKLRQADLVLSPHVEQLCEMAHVDRRHQFADPELTAYYSKLTPDQIDGLISDRLHGLCSDAFLEIITHRLHLRGELRQLLHEAGVKN